MTNELNTLTNEIVSQKLIKEASEARVEAEFQLVQLKNMIRALDESSIVSIIDTEGNIKYVNDKFCEISKYSREEILGKNFQTLRAEIHPPEFYDKLWNKIKSGRVWNGEICNKAKDGSSFWNKATIVPFFDKYGKIIEYVTIRTDITQQKQNVRLLAIGELAARIAHDLRNPLGVLKNTVHIMISEFEKNQNVNLKQNLERLNRAVSRMTHQVENVLEFVKVVPLKLRKISLLTVIRSSIDRADVNSTKIKLPQDDIEIVCDSNRLEVAFANIVQNSIHAINDNGQLEIRFKDNHSDVVIEFEDSGPGIPQEFMGKIFDPLFSTKQTGTGLGLVTTKNIVEQHKGEITVKNNPTIFSIQLPKNFSN